MTPVCRKVSGGLPVGKSQLGCGVARDADLEGGETDVACRELWDPEADFNSAREAGAGGGSGGKPREYAAL